jgi:Domain of unknown function(DUF2779)
MLNAIPSEGPSLIRTDHVLANPIWRGSPHAGRSKLDKSASRSAPYDTRPMLTKSDLASFRQCPRRLWLEHHGREFIPQGDATTWRRANDGNIVGTKARELLGPNVIWPKGADDRCAAANAAIAQLSAHPGQTAVEVPMFRNGLYARADALIPSSAGGYILRETKASTFPLKADKVTTGKPEEHHLDDVAIQAWVYQATGWPLAGAELNLLNNQWRYPGNNDYSGLFRQLSVTADIQTRIPEVPNWHAAAQRILAGPLPDTQTGKQCTKPYDCPFHDHCTTLDTPGPEHPLTLLPGSGGKNLARRLNEQRGYTALHEPQPSELTGSDAALFCRMQIAHRTGQPILETGSAAAFAALPYPRYYFDFEGIDLPVPRWIGVRPYEQIPFQWSCHIEQTPGVFVHVEFLDLSGDDPSIPCIERMLEAIPPDGPGPIFVYYQTYEAGRLRELADRHPQYRMQVDQYLARIVDLHPIVRDNYYHPAMRGSFSIKAVLPTIAPDLDYENLDVVADGTGAQVAYLYAALDPQTPPARKAELRDRLLVYCKQDTWAMVEVASFLQRLGRSLGTKPLRFCA